jgi:DNA-binding SARP family transcriptional activator
VRVFGGLIVTTPHGVVADKTWRKRKARLLFAMLVVKRGQDVPRDQLLDYLWPDKDDEKARNNFYVVWNALKKALSPDAEKGEPSPYVESVGGLCRAVTELVRSDIDDFEDYLIEARDADAAGDAEAALRAYEGLRDVYRGDLLPGDVYDDWFAAMRDRYRQDFGDAMVRAGQLYDRSGRPEQALNALRVAIERDSLREDLYQELLRCQIAAGQRSAAVDTYLTCRARLTEELGLDPSTETQDLYSQVLAMDEGSPGLNSAW